MRKWCEKKFDRKKGNKILWNLCFLEKKLRSHTLWFLQDKFGKQEKWESGSEQKKEREEKCTDLY